LTGEDTNLVMEFAMVKPCHKIRVGRNQTAPVSLEHRATTIN